MKIILLKAATLKSRPASRDQLRLRRSMIHVCVCVSEAFPLLPTASTLFVLHTITLIMRALQLVTF